MARHGSFEAPGIQYLRLAATPSNNNHLQVSQNIVGARFCSSSSFIKHFLGVLVAIPVPWKSLEQSAAHAWARPRAPSLCVNYGSILPHSVRHRWYGVRQAVRWRRVYYKRYVEASNRSKVAGCLQASCEKGNQAPGTGAAATFGVRFSRPLLRASAPCTKCRQGHR